MRLDDLKGPECVRCGASLEGKRSDAVYCSYECYMVDYHQLVKDARLEAKANRPPCKQCGKPIPVVKDKRAIYCSISCQQKACYNRRKSHPSTCRICSKGFLGMTPGEKYCTPSCRAKAGLAVRALKWKPKMICIQCGTPFKARPGGKHCSQQCRLASSSL